MRQVREIPKPRRYRPPKRPGTEYGPRQATSVRTMPGGAVVVQRAPSAPTNATARKRRPWRAVALVAGAALAGGALGGVAILLFL